MQKFFSIGKKPNRNTIWITFENCDKDEIENSFKDLEITNAEQKVNGGTLTYWIKCSSKQEVGSLQDKIIAKFRENGLTLD